MSKTLNSIVILGLLAVVSVQGYYLYRISGQLETLTRAGHSPDRSQSTSPGRQFGAQFWNLGNHDRAALSGELQAALGYQSGLGGALPFGPNLSVVVGDLIEENSRYRVEVTIAQADTLSLDVRMSDDRTLSVSAIAGAQHDQPFFGQFQRIIALPGPADAATLTTHQEGEILTITVAKQISA